VVWRIRKMLRFEAESRAERIAFSGFSLRIIRRHKIAAVELKPRFGRENLHLNTRFRGVYTGDFLKARFLIELKIMVIALSDLQLRVLIFNMGTHEPWFCKIECRT